MEKVTDTIVVLLISTELSAIEFGEFSRHIHLGKVIEILEANHQYGYECGCLGCYIEKFRVAYYAVTDKEERVAVLADFIYRPISDWLESNPEYKVDGFETDHVMDIDGVVNTLGKSILNVSDTLQQDNK